MKTNQRKRNRSRRGAVAVEFAFVAPIFVVIVLGLGLASRLTELQNHLSTAAVEGGRLASGDRSSLPESQDSTNERVEQEILNILESQGIDSRDADVTITHADNDQQPFNLDSPANSKKLFRVRVEVPYSDAGTTPFPGSSDYRLRGEVVFRNPEVLPSN